MKYKVGDRVRRSSYKPSGEPATGTLGAVVELLDEHFRVQWAGDTRDDASLWSENRLEPADAPAVGAPVPNCGSACGPRRCEMPPGHDGFCRDNINTPEEYRWHSAPPPKPGGDWVSGKEHATLKGDHDRIAETLRQQNKQIGELEAALKEATGSKLRVGDLHGTVAALRSRVVELEGNEAWLRREVVRLGGKARMR